MINVLKIACLIVISYSVFFLLPVSEVRSQTNSSLGYMSGSLSKSNPVEIQLPFLEKEPVIDADLNDWKDYAYHDGVWDIYRVSNSYWYKPDRNRLTVHGNEPRPEFDLQSRYYMAWDHTYLYFGAEVYDNVNDVSDQQHEPKRWYYKDCICWFIEAPRDSLSEAFEQGDNAFCFIADDRKPCYGAWWRHGASGQSYIEEQIPKLAVSYQIRMNPWGRSPGDYILEARVNMSMTLAKSDPTWRTPETGDVYSIQIVHTDPDGGDYGGHLIIYGTGDNDGSWGKMIFAGSKVPLVRKHN